MQKYRFWDIEGRPYSSVFFMLVIDFSQIYYRLVMFALVAAFAGPVFEVALALGMSVLFFFAMHVQEDNERSSPNFFDRT